MSRMDTLIQITAEFFYKGDKASAADLEDYLCWEEPWEDCSIEIQQPEVEVRPGEISELDEIIDTEFTHDTIGFRVDWITEGRCDYNYGSGVDFESREVGMDWFKDGTEEYVKTAKQIKDEIENKKRPFLGRFGGEPELPVRKINWIEGVGYWSSHDSYTGEYDGGVEFYGRVKLHDIEEMLKEQSSTGENGPT